MRHGLVRMDQWIHPTSEWKVHRKQRKAPDSRIEVSRFFVELGAFQFRRSSGSIAPLVDRPRQAAMRSRHICGCHCGRFLRQPLSFLCTTSGRSGTEGLTTKFHSLEFSQEGLILYTASFYCQYHVSSIHYRVFRFVTVMLFHEIRMRKIGLECPGRGKSGLGQKRTMAFNCWRLSEHVH